MTTSPRPKRGEFNKVELFISKLLNRSSCRRVRRYLGNRRSCVHEAMNPECESHYHAGGRNRSAVEGNCVAAMRGGEQPETEGWSRTKVNSIRQANRASLRANGEACRVSGEPVTVQGLPILETGRVGCGWSGNDWKGTWDKWRERPGSRREGSVAVRAFIVAVKPGNAGGAKGRRKMKTPETVRDPTSSIAARLERGSAVCAVRVGNGCLEAILGTGCLR
jgi:hypothetical protein